MQINNLKITGLTLKNFLSIGNATQALKFDEHGMTLVLGNNSDANGGTTRNGAGKTSILQGLSFALYGKPLTDIKIGNLVNNINQKAMHVVVDFEKAGVKYRIERGRNPTIMKWYINGEDVTEKENNDAKGENPETQIDINRILGMTHTMFKHIVALNTYTTPFLRESAASQRGIIEELLGVTQISSRAEKLKVAINTTKDNVKTLEATLSATKAANVRIERSVEEARKKAGEWENKQETAIRDIKDTMATIGTIDFDEELRALDAIEAYNIETQTRHNTIQSLTSEKRLLVQSQVNIMADIKRSKDILYGSIEQTTARLNREIDRSKSRLTESHEKVTYYTEQVAHFAHLLENPGEQDCKTCGQPLDGTDHLQYVIKRFTEEKAKSEAQLVDWTENTSLISVTIAELQKEIDDVIGEDSAKKANADIEIARLSTDLAEINGKIEVCSQKTAVEEDALVALNGKPTAFFDTKDQLYSVKYEQEGLVAELARMEAETNPYVTQINGLRKAIQPIEMDSINRETDMLKHQEYLFKLLTSKDSFIRRKIIEQNLTFLNHRLNHYLNKLGLPHEVIFQSDLSVEIMLLGRDYDYAQLSRGESNRVIMATSWAFRDVWESLNNRVNLIFIDEMIDSGLDSNGAESALQILKSFTQSGRNVFLISHRDELIGRIDRTLYVSKENGFTSIIEEEV